MRKFLAVAAFAATAAVAATGLPSVASDHLDAPLVKNDGRTDINDVYVFDSPEDSDKVVLAMTVNPGAGVISGTSFDKKAKYVFDIDTNGDAVADDNITVDFGRVHRNGRQSLTLEGLGLHAEGNVGETLSIKEQHGRGDWNDSHDGRKHARSGWRSYGWDHGHDRNRHRHDVGVVRADVFDDPFFFDLAAFRNGLQFCPGGVGTDFFLGLNTSAIVVELPKSALTHSTIGVVGRTLDKHGRQIDRFGRPAINTVFNKTDADKNAFNVGQPADDQANFRTNVVGTLLALGNDAATANSLADFLLPDVMTVDLSKPTVFPNGRGLADDVIDTELGLISGGAVPSDCVANDSTFQNTFPYFGSAN